MYEQKDLLTRLLAADYAHFKKVGADDWRDPTEKNPGFSLSTKGWSDFNTGESGSLFELCRKHNLLDDPPPKQTASKPRKESTGSAKQSRDTSELARELWKQAELRNAKERQQEYLTGKRGIPSATVEKYQKHFRVTHDVDKKAPILINPMLTPDQVQKAATQADFGEVLKVHRTYLETPEDGKAKKMLGKPEGAACLGYLPPHDGTKELRKFLIVEGLEDGLSVCPHFPDRHLLITHSKSNLKLVPRFLSKEAEVLILSDHDNSERPSENGQTAAAALRDELRKRKIEVRAVMPQQVKFDANDALKGGDLDSWLKTLVEVPEPPQPTEGETPDSSVVSEMYQFSEAGTSRWKETRDGQILVPLGNFTARIVEEQLLDDGEVKELHYRIEAERAGEALPEVVIASEQFAKLDFVAKHYGTKAQIFPGIAAKDYLRHAIQVRSGENVPRVSVFTCTGLTEINGQLTYLSGNGALDAENVEVRLDATGQHQLARYQLPASSTPEEKRAGIRASLSFLEVASDVVTIPLWTATYAATIISELEDHFASLFLLGPTGCRKTSLAVSALCHHGLFTTDELFTFNDTTNSLEKAAFTLRDAPMLVDDFYPTTNRRDQDRMVSVFESLTRSAGNRTGRGRMNSDLSLRRSFHPRGMVLFTGEDLIGATSALARLNLVEIEPNDVDLGKLSALQRQHSLLPHALCDFLRWWRDHREQARSLFNNKNLENSLYQTHGSSLHGRLPRQIALWQRMFEVLCLWLIDRDELTQAEAQELHERACQVFVENAQRLQERIQTSTPAQRFLEIVQSLQSSGRLWLKSWSGEGQERPQDAEFFGWRRGDAVYVQGSTVWHLIQGYCQREGSTFPVGQKTLWEHLKRDGVLELQNGKISESSRVPAEDKSQRLIKLRIERLFQSV